MATNQDIIALAKQRIPPKRIAERLGVTRDTVYSCISYARQRGEDIPRFRTGETSRTLTPTMFYLSKFVRVCFEAPARARGLTPMQLAHRLLEQIAEEPALIDAVLDDRADQTPDPTAEEECP